MDSDLTKSFFSFLKDVIYLFFRERRREGEREGNINVWLPLVRPHRGPGPQPRLEPWLGIELATLWFAGPCSIHWATTSQGPRVFLMEVGDISKEWKLFSKMLYLFWNMPTILVLVLCKLILKEITWMDPFLNLLWTPIIFIETSNH